VVLDAIQMEFL